MNKSKGILYIKSAILSITLLLVAAIVMGVTGAYYSYRKNFAGFINLSAGLSVDFNQTIGAKEGEENNFPLLIYNSSTGDDITTATAKEALNATGAGSDSEYYLVSPKMTSKTNDGWIYLRIRLEYTSTGTGNPVLTPEQMTEVFGTQTPLQLTSDWLLSSTADDSGHFWYYYTGETSAWTEDSSNVGDLEPLLFDEDVSFFTSSTSTTGVEYTTLALSGERINENFSIPGFEIAMIIDAVTGNAGEVSAYFEIPENA